MVDESIIMDVVLPDEKSDVKLEIRNCDGSVLEFWLDGKIVFSGDWFGNFVTVFRRALEIWTDDEDEKEES